MATSNFVLGALVFFQILLLTFCQNIRQYNGPRLSSGDTVETLGTPSTFNENDWIEYSTPSTPRPQDVNCHVEVPTIMRVGGTCVRYGESGSYWLCQSGVNAQMSRECQFRSIFQGRRSRNRRQRSRRRNSNSNSNSNSN